MVAVPSGQAMVMVTLLPDCLKSVILHFSLPRELIAFFASPFSVHTWCFWAPMPAGMPGMFICELTSQSSSLPAANDVPKPNAKASVKSVFKIPPFVVEPRANYDLGSAHAGCPDSRRPRLRRQ